MSSMVATPTSADASPVVDARLPLHGEWIPLDHGYALLGAVARVVPALHQRETWGLHTVRGEKVEDKRLRLHSGSAIQIRLPANDIKELFPLIGRSLEVAGREITAGGIEIAPLYPAARLIARIVTIKGFLEPEPFRDAVRKQLIAVDGLDQDPEQIELTVGKRRVMRIHNKTVVGFQVWLHGLDAAASLAIQRTGLGGRRHMGAGLFVPVQRAR
jgi:CRISPR-associated protein Cas6